MTSAVESLLNSSPSVVDISKTDDLPLANSGSSSDLAPVADEQVLALEALSSESTTKQEANYPFWRVFASTFATIFLAEIGDKTQVSTLLMSAEFHKPWVVFLGAGMALVATTLIGVWVGQWLSSRLSPRTLDVAAGIMLALISASLIWDVFQI